MRRSWILFGLLVVALAALPARADEVLYQNRALTCVAPHALAVRMWIDNLSFGLAPAHAWGRVQVHLVMGDRSERSYLVNGTADLTPREIAHNGAPPSFTYDGITCTVRHRKITAVENCRSGIDSKTCDVALHMFGGEKVYAVSLSIAPMK